MMSKSVLRGVVAAIAVCAAASLAQAGQYLELQSDESQMIALTGAPGAVILGNPSIADVSIDGTNIFLHGRGYGQTSLLILDAAGKQLANFDLTVKHTQVTNVALFRGPSRFSFSCAPYCETELQIGDDADNFKNIAEEIQKKGEIATGSKTAEAKAPAAPQ
jgi:Pilus formation protein N terminal region